MRKYQLTLKLSVFDGTRTEEEGRDLNVYVDGNNIWGVICGGFQELTNALVRAGKHMPLAFGAREVNWR